MTTRNALRREARRLWLASPLPRRKFFIEVEDGNGWRRFSSAPSFAHARIVTDGLAPRRRRIIERVEILAWES